MADDNNQIDDAVQMDDAFAEDSAKICKVYDKEDFFTVFVQMLLAAFALFSLWIKRQNEKPRRKFRTWSLDVSKQGIGACYAHVANMVSSSWMFDRGDDVPPGLNSSRTQLYVIAPTSQKAIASVIISNTRGDTSLNDQCAWYGMCYLVDTTLGLVLAVWGLRIIDWLAQKFNWDSLKQSGVYEGVDGLLHWFWQVFAWLVNLTVGKVIIYYFMVLFSQPLAMVGGILFAPLQSNIRFELLFVMIFFPGFLNVIYFWIADSHLQAKGENTGAHEEEAEMTQQRKEALLPDGESDEAEPPIAATTLV